MHERADKRVLEKLLRNGTITMPMAKYFASLGFLNIPKTNMFDSCAWSNYVLDAKAEDNYKKYSHEKLFMRQFMLYYGDGDVYAQVIVKGERNYVIAFTRLEGKEKHPMIKMEIIIKPTEQAKIKSLLIGALDETNSRQLYSENKFIQDYIRDYGVLTITRLQLWMDYNHFKKQYLFEVNPLVKETLNIKLPLGPEQTLIFGQMYIYLPGFPMQEDLDRYSLMVPMAKLRPAHKRVLMDEYFYKHAKFRQPEGIAVRASCKHGVDHCVVDGYHYKLFEDTVDTPKTEDPNKILALPKPKKPKPPKPPKPKKPKPYERPSYYDAPPRGFRPDSW